MQVFTGLYNGKFIKTKFIIAVVASLTAVIANPSYHRPDTSVGGTSASGDNCPCGTVWDGETCADLDCPTVATCDPVCSDTDSPEGTELDNYLGKKKKACRFNNDASCHKCPSTSCQYQFGNYWGSGFPCIHLEGAQTFGTVEFDATTQDGEGTSVTFRAYGATETVEFCNTDAFELETVGATCANNKIAVIVSPKTCTHCQVVRCLDIESDLSRYAPWNEEGFDSIEGKTANIDSEDSDKMETTIVVDA